MSEISIQEMMDAGAHFGHQTRRWNPKMKPYLYGARSGVHIIDLQQTQTLADAALKAVENIVAKGDSVLFVGTKKQAQPVIEEQAKRAQMPYVIRRWLGGMLTNFVTIRKSVDKLIDFETRREKQDFGGLTKKELLGVDRQIIKLDESFGGIKFMRRLPGAIVVVDPMIEKIAVHEANVLGIPVIAITDSNCDPDPIDFVIPANDDALRSIQVFTAKLADACLKGMEKRDAIAREEPEAKRSSEPARKQPGVRAKDVEGVGQAFVSRADEFVQGKEEVGNFSATVEKAPKTEGEVSK